MTSDGRDGAGRVNNSGSCLSRYVRESLQFPRNGASAILGGWESSFGVKPNLQNDDTEKKTRWNQETDQELSLLLCNFFELRGFFATNKFCLTDKGDIFEWPYLTLPCCQRQQLPEHLNKNVR